MLSENTNTFYCQNWFCFPIGCHWLEHSVQMLMLGKPELVYELDNNLMELRTSLEDINNLSNFFLDI